MEVFGWIALSVLAVFAIFILVIFTIPFVVTECKMMKEKIKRSIEDKKFDLEKRSEARRHRDEVKREKDFELANKKLDAKLQKVDKKIEIQTKKLKLAQSLKEDTKNAKTELMKKAPAKKEHKIEEKTNIQELEEIINEEETIVAGTDTQ